MYQFYRQTRDLIEKGQDTRDGDQNASVPGNSVANETLVSDANLSDPDDVALTVTASQRPAAKEVDPSRISHTYQETSDVTIVNSSPPVSRASSTNTETVQTTQTVISNSVTAISPVAGPSSVVRASSFSPLSGATSSSDSPYTTSSSPFPSFQKYFKLSDSLIQTKRFKKKKTERPDAITGSAYFQMETQKQEEKRRKLRQQEERKKKRIQKQLEAQAKGSKTVGKRTRQTASSSESDDENNIVFDDSDDNVGFEEDNCCAACLGNDDWNVDSAWIGCSNERCNKWFHKNCISIDVGTMTEEQLQKYEYFCKMCAKKQ